MGKRNRRAKLTNGALYRFFSSNLIGEVIGNVIGQMAADGAERLLSRASGEGDGGRGERGAKPDDDPAARVLGALAGREPKSLASLVGATGMGLSAVMGALETSQRFGLVELSDGGSQVVLTDAGAEAVAAVARAAATAASDSNGRGHRRVIVPGGAE